MKNYIQDDFIQFEYKGETLFCKITDNNSPIRTVRGIEKMNRYLNFYNKNREAIITGWAKYGTVEEMTNISQLMLEQWYEEYLNKRDK